MTIEEKLAELEAWFLDQAKELPSDSRKAVLWTLDAQNPRHVWLEPHKLQERGLLPGGWSGQLEIYYSFAF